VERLPNLFGLDRDALRSLFAALGEPAYRAQQVYSWLYEKRVASIDDMTDLPKALRERLAAAHVVRWPVVRERAVSTDGTIKFLFQLDDGATIESVFIPEERRRTICISTQAGCPLKCAFCLTGIGGYKRNLKPWEILGQVAVVMADVRDGGLGGDQKSPPLDEARGIHFRAPEGMPWNIVIMGMGEPLLNYDATVAALRILMDREGFAISPKKLTLSTVGILPALEKLMLEPVRPNLAISLHASNKALRRELMPIEDRYGIEDVIAAAQRYPIPSGGMVTYEYVVLGGVNDSPAHARELVRLLRGSKGKVNLIPLNPAPEIPFAPPTAEAVDAFCRILSEGDVMVSVRRPRGQDILAACGQLHLKREAAPAPVAS
jgi:23S rRNA (adenine2503-C2)-methyltransferase